MPFTNAITSHCDARSQNSVEKKKRFGVKKMRVVHVKVKDVFFFPLYVNAKNFALVNHVFPLDGCFFTHIEVAIFL